MSKEQIGALWMVSASVAYGFMPIWTVLGQNSELTTDFILFFRFACASALLFLLSRFEKIPILLPKRKILEFLFLGGILYSVQSFAYLDSLRYIQTALSVMLYHIYPVIVTLVALMFFKEKIQLKTLLALVLCIIGLVVILQIPKDITLNHLGVTLSLIGALFYGLYVIFSQSITRNCHFLVASFYVCFFSSIAMFLSMLRAHETMPNLFEIPFIGIFALLALTIFSTLFAMVAYYLGMPKIGITKTAILGMIEPLVAVVLSIWILGDTLSALQYFGAFLIIFGSILLCIRR
ncbi:DMT family transporter [Helicobacter sp. Faydin-H64]|uniref:DMT family transporter n=1 Tax=Helicobacter turcicus TaxID=2867412 RepID=A0ABS7JPY2_9HELI|nr:DMT family transporter [Helicobacter turcicus]MBX7491471.1 DMT family transporter [Helicobacter turcicus]MBX7545930.1 DMT family transporter [Helicobacter turcicus]